MPPPLSTSFQNATAPLTSLQENSKENYHALNFNVDGSSDPTGILSSPLCSSAKDNKTEHSTATSTIKDKSKCDNSILNMTILFPELSCTPTLSNDIDNLSSVIECIDPQFSTLPHNKNESIINSSVLQHESFGENQYTSQRNIFEEDSENHNDDVKESLEQRIAREQQESEDLARQLMADEAMASYSLSVNYLQDNADAFSPEDLAAFNIALTEEEQFGVDEIDEEFDESIEDLSYDAMLRLGERMGDVKEERWRMVSKKEIAKLPTVTYKESLLGKSNAGDDSLHSCLVCQCCYENGETLRKLPCKHQFHKDCVDQWLHSKDFCPYCRQSIV